MQPVHNNKRAFLLTSLIVLVVVFVMVLAGIANELLDKNDTSQKKQQTSQQQTSQQSSETKVEGLVLDPNKQYGNKYANGVLPVGDKKYTTDAAKKGYVYMCRANFVPENQAGAQVRGPWFVNNNTQWDSNKKPAVDGNVTWKNNISMSQDTTTRIISTNDLPDHHTGVFPVASSDDAYKYDKNPNSIKQQTLTYALTKNPTYGAPQCMGNESGIMLSGSALFNAFDAGGRDAGVWEVQDSCDGHPQAAGEYHYHTLSRCITDVSVSKVIGFALDGYPITGPKVGDNNILTTDDLDECHGIVSAIELDGKTVTTYHYVMTQDFPYSVSCFRATPIQPPRVAGPAGRP